jgi:hypothetical protein
MYFESETSITHVHRACETITFQYEEFYKVEAANKWLEHPSFKTLEEMVARHKQRNIVQGIQCVPILKTTDSDYEVILPFGTVL